jgi:hypothetical protein
LALATQNFNKLQTKSLEVLERSLVYRQQANTRREYFGIHRINYEIKMD